MVTVHPQNHSGLIRLSRSRCARVCVCRERKKRSSRIFRVSYSNLALVIIGLIRVSVLRSSSC